MSLSPRTFSHQTLSDSPDATDAPLVVVPWSQFGARRLYVDTADGRRVGWVDLNTGHRCLVIPELAPAFAAATAGAPAARTPRRALDEAIEFALITGYAAAQTAGATPTDVAQESTPAAEEPPEDFMAMRRAYRGKQAFSSWELGACGRRLAEEPVPTHQDPRLAYLNCTSAEVTHLFA
jgi:hypothetical protein